MTYLCVTGITPSIRPRQQSDPSEKAEENGRVAEVQLRCRCMYCGKWKAEHTLHVSFARKATARYRVTAWSTG